MAMNLAAKYSAKVDEKFTKESFTEAAVNKDYEWTGVKTISVYGVDTVAMGNYTRTGLARYGTAAELGNTKTDYTLSRDRAFTFAIDRGNQQETMGVMEAGKALARQLREVVIPEVDTYRLAAMSAAAITNGHTATAAITASNAYVKFLAAQEALDEDKVPVGGRIAFVTPAYYNFIKQDTSFQLASEIAMEKRINGQVGDIDGVKIVKVPSSYFPASHAFILCHPVATVAPKKLEDYKTHDNPPGINGWLVEGRQIYDAFVLTNKVNALFAHKIA
ncbi:phage major capsid protein [Paenibacillus silvisoli]|uniref:phage major capsid protein n=1 Tax=Paenibacillus silvisoli TaxID=3110539 RepID=UPI0028057947|nr:N4-gp56 family major capsid protein [Paenibacillus silvisoli]